jgi:hypothetical protein
LIDEVFLTPSKFGEQRWAEGAVSGGGSAGSVW